MHFRVSRFKQNINLTQIRSLHSWTSEYAFVNMLLCFFLYNDYVYHCLNIVSYFRKVPSFILSTCSYILKHVSESCILIVSTGSGFQFLIKRSEIYFPFIITSIKILSFKFRGLKHYFSQFLKEAIFHIILFWLYTPSEYITCYLKEVLISCHLFGWWHLQCYSNAEELNTSVIIMNHSRNIPSLGLNERVIPLKIVSNECLILYDNYLVLGSIVILLIGTVVMLI